MAQSITRRMSAGLAIAMLLISLAPTAAQAANDAGKFLVSFGEQAAEELRNEALSPEARERRFRELFRDAVDIPAIGKFILGRHWRRASAQEQSEFLAVFEDAAAQRILPMFTGQSDEYAGKSFDVVDVRRSERQVGHVFVRTRVERPEGPPVEIVWRIRERDERYKVLDVMLEGISMSLTLRDEYGSVIKQRGSVMALVELLRQKVASGAFSPKNKAE